MKVYQLMDSCCEVGTFSTREEALEKEKEMLDLCKFDKYGHCFYVREITDPTDYYVYMVDYNDSKKSCWDEDDEHYATLDDALASLDKMLDKYSGAITINLVRVVIPEGDNTRYHLCGKWFDNGKDVYDPDLCVSW